MTFDKLQEFLTRDDPHIFDCRKLGCKQRVWKDDNQDVSNLKCPEGHTFCGTCDHGPHCGITCEARLQQVEASRKEDADLKDQDQADTFEIALRSGWKPCPKKCKYGGGFKASEECDHVTCLCLFEFCWCCGVDRLILLAHDNRWHKPSCQYHSKPEEVEEVPKYMATCPECQKNECGTCCVFPVDDGYPESFVRPGREDQRG